MTFDVDEKAPKSKQGADSKDAAGQDSMLAAFHLIVVTTGILESLRSARLWKPSKELGGCISLPSPEYT